MNVSFRCPKCDRSVRAVPGDGVVACPACGTEIQSPPDAWHESSLQRCLVCPSRELYVRKDFPQQWGLSIIIAGFVFSSIAWAYYQSLLSLGILIGTALLDAVLYWLVGNVVSCYRCHAEYRGLPDGKYSPFDLAVHERHRRQAARQSTVAAGR